MDIREHIDGFNRRWNITLENDPENKFRDLKTRVLNHLREIKEYLNDIDLKDKWYDIYAQDLEFDAFDVISILKEQTDLKEFYRLIEMILNHLSNSDLPFLVRYVDRVKKSIEVSDVNGNYSPPSPLILV